MKISSPLYERLISYTGVAAAMLIANNKVAEAQIIYTDINPDYSHPDWPDGLYEVDVNNDGIADFEFHEIGFEGFFSYPNSVCPWSSNYVIALGSNEVLNDGKPVDNEFLIGSQEDWDGFGSIRDLSCSWNQNGGGGCQCFQGGNWAGAGESKFMGLRFVKDNLTYYGWIRLRVWGNYFEDYAFESIPGEPITAGAVENCDTLQVTISPSDSIHVCTPGNAISLHADYPLTTYDVNLRWQKDEVDIPGAVSKTYVVSQPGIYRAILYGYGCADTTISVPVTYSTVIAPPTELTQHLDTLFSSPQANYIWYKNSGTPLSGATNQYHVINGNGLYKCNYLDSLNCPSAIATLDATSCSNTTVSINQGSTGIMCANSSYSLCCAALPANCSYQWLFNGELIPAASYSCLTTTYPGNYTVAIEGYQGCTDTSATFLLIADTVPTPIITIINDTILQSNSATNNRWYLNGVFIQGSYNQTYVPTEQGVYQVKVTDIHNCSTLSAPLYFYPVSISNPDKENDFILFIVNKQLNVQFSQLPLHSKMMVVDLPGNHLFESAIDNSIMTFDVTHFADGVYFVIVDDGKSRRVKKVFIGD